MLFILMERVCGFELGGGSLGTSEVVLGLFDELAAF
jgi:hypothetical protein